MSSSNNNVASDYALWQEEMRKIKRLEEIKLRHQQAVSKLNNSEFKEYNTLIANKLLNTPKN